jgi:hypothetical protein
VWLPEKAVLASWRVMYWLTFCLTWFILPLLGEYCDSGFRDTRARVLYSLRSNARYQLIYLGTAAAGLVYFILSNGLHGQSIKGLIMALAYAWGLVLAIGLMGHGLVALPRRLFKNARISDRLHRLETQAPKTKDSLDDAIESLDALESTVLQLKQRKTGTSKDIQEWIDELAETSSLPESRPGAGAATRATNTGIPAVVTERYLADLTRKLKRARHRKARFVDEWTRLIQQAQDMQTILDAAASKRLDWPVARGLKVLNPSMRFYLHAYIVPHARIALATLLGIASVLIIWSEVLSSFAPKLSIIGLTVVHHPGSSDDAKVPFLGQLTASLWLLYMSTTALYAVSDVTVWGNRALVRRQTYPESATWYSLQVAKLTVPLSYNFITMLPPSVFRETSFYGFLGKLINLTPLGKGFSAWFPCFILIPVLATGFNLYGKVKGVVGFGVLEDDSEENPSGFGTGGWREGRALIERELQARGEGGGAGSAVGLAARGSSLDGGSRAGLLSPHGSSSREPRRYINNTTNQEEDGEDESAPRHFYQDFGERVRNTFDVVERPAWMRDVTLPKFLNTESGDNAGGSVFGRLFGGSADARGGVRL